MIRINILSRVGKLSNMTFSTISYDIEPNIHIDKLFVNIAHGAVRLINVVPTDTFSITYQTRTCFRIQNIIKQRFPTVGYSRLINNTKSPPRKWKYQVLTARFDFAYTDLEIHGIRSMPMIFKLKLSSLVNGPIINTSSILLHTIKDVVLKW